MILSIIDVAVLSENGNLSIPKAIREKLHIVLGTKFAIIFEGDTLIFKKIQVPSTKEFETLMDKGTKISERNRINNKDIEEIFHKYRGITID
ncbi:MAG: hypothetical protein PVF58_21615 [Candidatus Methanofastidiosia archaeon]